MGLQDGEETMARDPCATRSRCGGGQRLHLGQLSLMKATWQKTHLLFPLTQQGTHLGNCHSEYSLQRLCVHT